LKVRLSYVSDGYVALLSDDNGSELIVPLRPDFSFGYGDARLCQTQTADFVRMLVLFFPSPGGPATADAVVFAETPE
jgi:hypothetical protein